MKQCKFCGQDLPGAASFCGHCGRAAGSPTDEATRGSGLQAASIDELDTAISIPVPGIGGPQEDTKQVEDLPTSDMATMPLSTLEEKEERRRRAAMAGIPLLLADMQPLAENAPMVQGTPQLSSVPSVQGTPQASSAGSVPVPTHLPAGSMGEVFHAAATQMIPALPAPSPVPHAPHPSSAGHTPHYPHPHHLHHAPRGRTPIWLIGAIIIPVLLILSFIGLGLTLFAPTLSLSGSSSVEAGGILSLHGSHFLPGSTVTLTLDDSMPLYFANGGSGVLSGDFANSPQPLSTSVEQAYRVPASSNTVTVGGDGTFDVNIHVSKSWSTGQHTIHATESLSHRSAELTFTIDLPGTIPSPSASPTTGASPSATVSPTGSATTTPAGLSCINPSSISLGPVSERYTQAVSSKVTLCTAGIGTVNWTASWNQGRAPWFQLDRTSGQITAPGQAQITVSALAGNLTPGSYSATVTFSSQSNNATESLSVSFTVQAGCIKGAPGTLSYTGVANASDPAPQTVAVANCGSPGTLSAVAQTSDGANWLSSSPTSNILDAGATTSVTVTASNLKVQLPAGTYTGTVKFSIGSGSFIVNVTLIVQAAPTLAVTPTIIFARDQCQPVNGNYICFVSLTNTSNTLSLTWSASSGLAGINFKPSGGTLAPGQTIRVEISVPQSDCPTKAIITFTGPGNAVNVEWVC